MNDLNPIARWDALQFPARDPGTSAVYRVLIVEDHADTLLMMRTILETLNFEVVEAIDGDMAFEVAIEQVPDLILMDSGLPLTDGVSVTRRIRSDQRVSKVPIVFLSGHALPSSKIAALEAGGNDYLTKPIDIEEMLSVMAKWLLLRKWKDH